MNLVFESLEELFEDRTLLRTLAPKSTLNFGKYGDLSIQSIIKMGHTGYLKWIYYNYEMINFNEEILNSIGIAPEDRIQKPGKNPNFLKLSPHEKVITKKMRERSKKEDLKTPNRGGKYLRGYNRMHRVEEDPDLHKSVLMARNRRGY